MRNTAVIMQSVFKDEPFRKTRVETARVAVITAARIVGIAKPAKKHPKIDASKTNIKIKTNKTDTAKEVKRLVITE